MTKYFLKHKNPTSPLPSTPVLDISAVSGHADKQKVRFSFFSGKIYTYYIAVGSNSNIYSKWLVHVIRWKLRLVSGYWLTSLVVCAHMPLSSLSSFKDWNRKIVTFRWKARVNKSLFIANYLVQDEDEEMVDNQRIRTEKSGHMISWQALGVYSGCQCSRNSCQIASGRE